MTIIDDNHIDDEASDEVVIRLKIAVYDGDASDAVERALDTGVLQDAINDDSDCDVEVLDACIVFDAPSVTEAVASLLSQLNDAVICREAAEVDPEAVASLTRTLVAAVQHEAFTRAAQACVSLSEPDVAATGFIAGARKAAANECAEACYALARECV